MRKISLDLETSGLDPDRHVVLSIGMVDLETGEDFYEELDWEECTVTREALAVNRWNFSDGNVHRMAARPAADRADAWIRSRMGDEPAMALGKNVGFDLDFIKVLCETYCLESPFHYRKIDLSTLFYSIEESRGIPKDRIVAIAETKLTRDKPDVAELEAHNALYDAWWNVYCYRECMYIIRNAETRYDLPQRPKSRDRGCGRRGCGFLGRAIERHRTYHRPN